MHLAASRRNVGRESLVVFDVPRPISFRGFTVELVKQFRGLLSEDVDQNIQTASMRHTDNRFHNTV